MYVEHVNHFGYTRSYSFATLAKRKLVSVRLEIVLISGQHRYMVCVECTMLMEIILAPPMVLLGVVSHVEARLGPFGGSVSFSAR